MSKPHIGKFINCLNCNKEFYIPTYRFKTAKFCSKKCHGLYSRTKINTICKICGKEFSHISSRCNKAKYCSRKCYHKGQSNKGHTIYSCHHCGKEFKDALSHKRKFCSRGCVNKCTKAKFNPHFSTVRKMMIRRKMIEKCQICGYDSIPDVLGIHHRDKNKNNNSIENLVIVCPMCHSLIHHKHICH